MELIQINVDTNESRGEKLLTKRIEKRMTYTIFNPWSQFLFIISHVTECCYWIGINILFFNIFTTTQRRDMH